MGLSTSDEKDDTSRTNRNRLPVDRGWAWFILVAAWMNGFLLVGSYKAFGLIFVLIQERYKSSTSVTSVISSLLNASFSVTTLLVSNVGLKYFSRRQSVMTGGIVICLAYSLSAFAPNVQLIIVLLGFLQGCGHGLVMAPTLSLLSMYFEKRRGLVNCIAAAGGSVGSVVYPFILRPCLDTYGFSGTMLMLGALNLQVTVAGALLTPVSFYTERHGNHTDPETELNSRRGNQADPKTEPTIGAESIEQMNGNGDMTPHNKHVSNSQINKPTKDSDHKYVLSPLLHNSSSPLPFRAAVMRSKRRRTESEFSKTSVTSSILTKLNASRIGLYASTELSVSSMLDIHKAPDNTAIRESNTRATDGTCKTSIREQETDKTCCTKFNIAKIDCSLLKRLTFLYFIPCACLLCNGCSMVVTFLPPHAKDLGFSDMRAGFLITLIGITDMCAIILWGVLADKQWIRRHNLIALAGVCIGTITFFMPFYTSVTTIEVFSVMYGLFGRVYFSLYPVVLVDFLGVNNLSSAMGVTYPSTVTFNAIMLPIVGLMRDNIGTFTPGYQLMAAYMVTGALGMAALPLVEKCERKRKSADNEDENRTLSEKKRKSTSNDQESKTWSKDQD